ncbi:MAG TPA: hypothetical protein VHY91_23730 [Pirellulales bacterium]|jgi:hypothetical protein|nr:hypothetical protein [Pirellulales bacterium]
MKRRDFLLSTAALGSLALADSAPAAEQSAEKLAAGSGSLAAGPLVKAGVYQAGSLAQLFVDQLVVGQADNVSFTLHPARKHPANPLVMADQPWEGWRLEIYGNVIFDHEEQLFKMWYIGDSPEYFPGIAALYATSTDGIHWQKPLVGTIEARLPGKNNAVASGTVLPNVFKDTDDADPARRYKMITYHWDGKSVSRENPDQGYHTYVSPDGLHWTRNSEKRICESADVITGFYDRRRKLWVALAKIYDVPAAKGRRVFWLITSSDFQNWSEPQLAIYPDARDDAGAMARIEEVRSMLDVPDDPALVRTEFYGVGFYQAESCLLGFPWVFTINNQARFGNQEGPSELQLAVTRDLEHWERPFRLPCVERGSRDQCDPGFITTASEALCVGDEIWLYYTAANYLHGTPCLYRADDPKRKTEYTGSIALAIWALDRFVSVDGPAEGGRLTTVPLAFAGNRLELNVNTNHRGQAGSVRVELLDAAQKPLAGLGLSDEIKVDAIRHTVTWSGNSDVSRWQGQPISLRFHLASAELFSFAFRQAKA